MTEALIGLIGIVAGALLSNAFGRVLEILRRREREADLIVALHAEIVAGLRGANEQTNSDEAEYARNDDDPFGLPDRTDFVFESVRGDPAVLPRDVIHPIVRYYKLVEQSTIHMSAFVMPEFKAQPQPSRRKYMKQLIEILEEEEIAAKAALRALEQAGTKRRIESLVALRREAGIRL